MTASNAINDSNSNKTFGDPEKVEKQEKHSLLGAADIRRIAAEAGIKPTKKYGQNFVIDPGTVRKIVRAANIEEGSEVLEVGPGLGSLTLGLLEAGANVTAIEIDTAPAERLPKTVEEFTPDALKRLEVINADALECNAENLPKLASARGFAMVSNLPYNVATPIILTLLERFKNLKSFVVMVQKEVADRLTAKEGSKIYGVPSVKLGWYGKAEKAGLVGRNVFWPAPHVDSALVKFTRENRFDDSLRELTFSLVDTAFGQRRKTLHAIFKKTINSKTFSRAGIDSSLRAETLTTDDFAKLAQVLRAENKQDNSQQNESESKESAQTHEQKHKQKQESDAKHAAAKNENIKYVVRCPAKTNLILHVGETRAEWGGRHELETVYCAVGITDEVTVRNGKKGSGIKLSISGDHLGDLENSTESDKKRNHAFKAALAMHDEARKSEKDGFDSKPDTEPDLEIAIKKRIPVAAGLGGGSADAAGTILAINELWNLHLPNKRLREIAASLGADVPFCLAGGLARGSGYGEIIAPIDEESFEGRKWSSAVKHIIVGAYDKGLSTPKVYETCDALRNAKKYNHEAALEYHPDAKDREKPFSLFRKNVYGTKMPIYSANDLEEAACVLNPRSAQAIRQAYEKGCDFSFVSGSGPTVIACAASEEILENICSIWLESGSADRIFFAEAPVMTQIKKVADIN